jgi:predicted phage terminase large subunit-like protein
MRGQFPPKELAVAIDSAREELYFYSRWMMLQRRGMKWLRAAHHPVICDTLTKVFRGEIKRLILNLPPRYSKTESVECFVSWALGHAPDSEFIYTSYSATLAAKNSWETRETVAHEAYREIFPGVTLRGDSQARDNWRTAQDGVVYAAGAGGTITGFGAGKERPGFGGAIIIDDPLKPDEATSEVTREGVITWFQNTLESRRNSSDTPIVVIMQRLHERDLAGWLLEGGNGENWTHVCCPAITDDGNALWPEKHTLEDLRRMEQANPWVFAGQYMQRPAPLEGALFKPDQIQTIDAEPAGVRWVRAWDLAATKDAGDYTASVRIGKWNDRIVVADVARFRGSPDEVERALVATASRDSTDCEIHIPQDPGQAGKSQIQYFTSKLVGYRVKSSPETGDKLTRASPFASQVNVGNVYMVRNPSWNRAFIEELRVFPNGTNDDQVDAASRGFAAIVGARRSFFG